MDTLPAYQAHQKLMVVVVEVSLGRVVNPQVVVPLVPADPLPPVLELQILVVAAAAATLFTPAARAAPVS